MPDHPLCALADEHVPAGLTGLLAPTALVLATPLAALAVTGAAAGAAGGIAAGITVQQIVKGDDEEPAPPPVPSFVPAHASSATLLALRAS